MSVQFGKWNFDGRPCAPEYLEKVSSMLAPYGPDSKETHSKDGVDILYRAFHTTKESRREKQPHCTRSGAVITWDGRLDNRAELIESLQRPVTANSTDIEIVGAAFERWGEKFLGKLIGDWAISIWNPPTRSLLLAKDPIGTRQLFYTVQKDCIVWCTTLDPLVLLAEKTFELCEEYVAGWFSSYPAAHLTPYDGILSVPPSSFVFLRRGKHTVAKHWDLEPEKRIHYRTDGEYEEHFRFVFTKAVQRNLRSDAPVLSELSGGRDSSSIVCVADTVLARGAAECPRLDTFSNYDDSEPNWNERPYFTKVEEKRGRTGWHVNVGQSDETGNSTPKQPAPESGKEAYVPAPNYPGYDGRTSAPLRACLNAQGNRVVLSGTGGDEVMGGVPNPISELQDLLATGRFRALARQLKVWALEKRVPWFYLLWKAVRDFFPVRLLGAPRQMRPAAWLRASFVRKHWDALHSYPSRTKLLGASPSFQVNASTLDGLRRQLACAARPFDPTYEKRYPFLDRDLVEFMFAIPREQLVRPKQRRSLMRRALVGIVPDEILNRKTKAFVERSQQVEVSQDWARLAGIAQDMVSSSLGIVDASRLSEALQKVRSNDENARVSITLLIRTFWLEGWLKVLQSSGIVNVNAARKPELVWQTTV